MSWTLKVSNGQIVLNEATGQIQTVEGNRKAAQDIANVILLDFDAARQYGSYLTAIVQNRIPFASELLIRFYIADAIGKLMAKQEQDPDVTEDEKIVQIDELLTTPESSGVVGFFVAVSTEDGGTAENGMMATQLDHLTEGF